MRTLNSVHLNKEDKIKQVEAINNFGTLQLDVVFESGYSVLIDEVILDQLDEHRNNSLIKKIDSLRHCDWLSDELFFKIRRFILE